jgi:hypothetical protein
MATSQGISPSRLSQDARFIPQQQYSPRSEVSEMFSAALALARLHVIVDGDGARCASCQATAAGVEELSHFPNCAADRVLKAWAALDSKVRRKPAVSATVLSPISAA